MRAWLGELERVLAGRGRCGSLDIMTRDVRQDGGDDRGAEGPREAAERFVWPPRNGSGGTSEASGTSETSGRSGSSGSGTAGATAQVEVKPWTPLTGHRGGTRVARPSREEIEARSAGEQDRGGWWAAVEQVWLGVTAPPLLERAREAGWWPDGPEHYCGRCGASVKPAASAADGREGCEECQGTKVPWRRIVRLGEYERPLDRWIHEVKFTRFRRQGEQLGAWLGESIAAEIERARAKEPGCVPNGVPVIVPVPMSPWHRLVRGIDHTMVLARGVRQTTGGEIVRALRRRYRPSQLDVRASDRQRNVSGAFSLVPKATERLEGRLVVVVDDVTTTGATLRACVRCLRGERGVAQGKRREANGVQIWVAAAAWTAEHRRLGPMT